MDPNSKEFKTLQKKWYKKLKDTGFDDIENSEIGLKRYHSFDFIREDRQDPIDNKREFYRIAGFFLNDYPFKTVREKEIWSLYSKGKTAKQVAVILKTMSINISSRTAARIIQNLKATMLEFYNINAKG
jgi:hypothetical protein